MVYPSADKTQWLCEKHLQMEYITLSPLIDLDAD